MVNWDVIGYGIGPSIGISGPGEIHVFPTNSEPITQIFPNPF